MNPGGSVKDRTAKGLITDAEDSGKLKPGHTIVEGTGTLPLLSPSPLSLSSLPLLPPLPPSPPIPSLLFLFY